MLQTVLAGTAALMGAEDLAHVSSALAKSSPKIVFPWLVPYDRASFASYQRHADVITHISPTWYSMRADLSIEEQVDPAVASFTRDHGILLIPLLKNERFSADAAHDILATEVQRFRAVDLIVRLVLDHDYDGINIDFEGPFGESRNRYSDFLAKLASRLQPEGKLLTVDVVPQLKPASEYPNSSWASPYDYPTIGQLCDAVMIMCYSYSVRKPGPLSPLWWLRDATGYARTHIPKEKVVVGMSFYGRHWIVNDQGSTHRDLKQAEAMALLSRSGAHLTRPAHDATPRFTWQDDQGQHIVHFEDRKSLTAKLKVARAAGVAGAAFWRLGQEEASQWHSIAKWM